MKKFLLAALLGLAAWTISPAPAAAYDASDVWQVGDTSRSRFTIVCASAQASRDSFVLFMKLRAEGVASAAEANQSFVQVGCLLTQGLTITYLGKDDSVPRWTAPDGSGTEFLVGKFKTEGGEGKPSTEFWSYLRVELAGDAK